MEKAIFDTSVWIDFSKGIKSAGTILLKKYLNENITALYLTPTIIQEFLMGLRQENDFLKYQFHQLKIPKPDCGKTSISATKLYFNLRNRGVSIRKSADCLIAQVAIENNVLLVHNNPKLIAQKSPLRTVYKN